MKRSVSLYSFQEEYFLGKLDLQGCLREVRLAGAIGVEVIGEQMFRGFPRLTDTQVDEWRRWLAEYQLTPVCHDMFLDTKRYRDRVLTLEESIDSTLRDIRFAARLGCTCIRMIVITPPEVMEACLRYAERYRIKLLLEIHSPFHFRHPWIEQHMEVMHRTASPYLGLMPDLGIFVRRFPRVIAERAIRDGATQALVHEIVAAYDAHGGLAALPDAIAARGGNRLDIALARTVGHFCYVEPREMLTHMGLIGHIHAKFYEMLPDETEYSIPYDAIISTLHEGGYAGYLSSEYEGNRHIQDAFEVDSVEQVRRHQNMMEKLIAAAESAAHV